MASMQDTDMEYNTSRSYLVMREYGRHIQKMVDYVLTIEDPKERQEQAHVVIELMGFLNPHLRNVEDFRHKLWDHLFFMSDFKLKVESPYPIPEKATYKSKPDPLPYPKRYPKYSHLGKNLELVVNKALKEENPEKKAGFANAIAYYMKLAYSNWHKELVHDDAIRSEMNTITGGQLEFSNTPYIKHRNQNFERDDYSSRGGGRGGDRDRGGRQQSYMGGRSNGGRSTGGRDSRDSRDNRGGGSNRSNGGRDMRDNRGGGDKRNNNRNQGFKKRF
ncbi:DUF4290 domain-containing protein [Panacibacter ginsenosidivorans]|nr:DUF4290 domain-containing protein [Panacibacter ginsenosidivorans]